MGTSPTFALWRRLAGKPGGKQLFSAAMCLRVPYFADRAAVGAAAASGALFGHCAEVVGCPQPHPDLSRDRRDEGFDLPVPVRILDARGTTVVTATITIWVTRKNSDRGHSRIAPAG